MNRVTSMKLRRSHKLFTQQASTHLIFLLILVMATVTSHRLYAVSGQTTPSPQAQSIKKQLHKLKEQKKEIKALYRGVLKGTLRNSLNQKIQTFQNHISDSEIFFKGEKYDKAHRQISLARHKQRRLRQKLAQAYLEQTTSMRKKIIKLYQQEILTQAKASKMLRLAHQEENRGNSYLRIHHYPLAIHTLRRSRSYLFRALKLINRPIPNSFFIALTDLKKLPKKHRPPQLISNSR